METQLTMCSCWRRGTFETRSKTSRTLPTGLPLLLAADRSLTNYLRAGGGAGSNYTFLTQKERDNETGLDYFGARYYSSTQGRFNSIDSGSFTPADPQNWNRYSCVQNNPLKFTDPTGRELKLLGDDAEYIKSELERLTGYKLTRDPKTGVVTIDRQRTREGALVRFVAPNRQSRDHLYGQLNCRPGRQ